MSQEDKLCIHCGKAKPLSDFHKGAERKYSARCKDCVYLYKAEMRAKKNPARYSFKLLEGEEFRDVAGWEGLYKVSNKARILSLERMVDIDGRLCRFRQKLLKPTYDEGYMRVSLRINDRGEHARIHVLMGKAFIPNPLSLPEINHKNGIKDDNRLENLEWITHQDNVAHAILNGLKPKVCRGILNPEKVVQIRERLSRGDMIKSIAEDYGVSSNAISSIKHNHRWHWVN